MTIEDIVRRPVSHVADVAQRHPGLWKNVDNLRAARGDSEIQHLWPSWCYLPMGAASAIVRRYNPDLDIDARTLEAVSISTLASWRVAKDIYLFDETVFEELWNTPIEGNIPVEVLRRLPTLCAYVAYPAAREVHDLRDSQKRGKCHGFFVHLQCGTSIRPPMLSILTDCTINGADQFGVFALDLREGLDLLQCCTVMGERTPTGPPWALENMGSLEPLLSLTLYLCSTSAEIRQRDPLRGIRHAYTKKTKKGVRVFVPEEPQVWEVAFRIGATLRAAAAATPRTGDGEGTHASPRPHMRKAHWHGFWTGPKAKVGEAQPTAREFVFKWLPPIPVAMGEEGETIPTVHRVTR